MINYNCCDFFVSVHSCSHPVLILWKLLLTYYWPFLVKRESIRLYSKAFSIPFHNFQIWYFSVSNLLVIQSSHPLNDVLSMEKGAKWICYHTLYPMLTSQSQYWEGYTLSVSLSLQWAHVFRLRIRHTLSLWLGYKSSRAGRMEALTKGCNLNLYIIQFLIHSLGLVFVSLYLA